MTHLCLHFHLSTKITFWQENQSRASDLQSNRQCNASSNTPGLLTPSSTFNTKHSHHMQVTYNQIIKVMQVVTNQGYSLHQTIVNHYGLSTFNNKHSCYMQVTMMEQKNLKHVFQSQK